MSTAIFIRSYAKDFEWLSFSLRSIHKFATGFCEVIIAVPGKDVPKLSHLTAETVIGVHDAQPGYLGQQWSKLSADMHTKADQVLHVDSDVILTRPVTPETFMRDGKPIWLMTPWGNCGMDARKAWMHVMTRCLVQCPEYEFMRKVTQLIPRFAYDEFRKFIKSTHGIELDAYIMNCPKHEFSEFNCLGFFLHTYFRDLIHWHNTETDGLPEPWDIQFWSWGGLTSEIRNKMNTALA